MAVGRVLGVDACPGGWVGVVLDRDRAIGRFAPTLAELVGPADDDLRVIAIDIPIGLPDTSVRQADVLVRGALGPRRSSLFMTPVRAAVVASTYDEANAINRRLVGQGVSRQSFGLRSRVLEADEFVVNRPENVIEVHPELSFATMAGTPLAHGKRTWVGARRRRELLRASGIVLDEVGPEVGSAGVDDVLDAAAAAWTARRRDRGTARAHPQPRRSSPTASAAPSGREPVGRAQPRTRTNSTATEARRPASCRLCVAFIPDEITDGLIRFYRRPIGHPGGELLERRGGHVAGKHSEHVLGQRPAGSDGAHLQVPVAPFGTSRS